MHAFTTKFAKTFGSVTFEDLIEFRPKPSTQNGDDIVISASWFSGTCNMLMKTFMLVVTKKNSEQ